ncbi:hypothetical protein GCM10028805_56550 [Spirosoma harenae]
MKIPNAIKFLGLMALLVLGPSTSPKVVAQPGVSVPVESFYDELAPYGQWTQYPNYGNVWIPNAGPDFQPYASGGHWVMTEYGNTWVSDYAWGWAPFHYGRWIYDPAYGGWIWVPGSDWAPAWVTWRSGGGYYGWAPLAPGWDINININIPAPYWTFVPQVYITSPNIYSYCVPRPRVINIYNQTTIINNYYRTGSGRSYGYGPQRGDIERITRQNVPIYRVDHMDRPGRSIASNGSVGFYRPGSSREYGPNRGYDNRYNNPRPNYDGNNTAYNRDRGGRYNGDFNNSRPNYDGNSNMPGRGDNGNTNRWDRNSFPTDRNGGFNNAPNANPGNIGTPSAPNMPSPSRGGYSPGNSPQGDGWQRGGRQMSDEGQRSFPQRGGGGFQQQPDRSVERMERQPQMNNPQMQRGGQNGGAFQRIQESQSQPSQQHGMGQIQRSGDIPGGGFGDRQSRGPR